MTRQADVRFRIMRNGADYGVLYPAEGSRPRISMRDTDAVKTSLSGTFLPPERPVDWLTDEIRPEIVIDGTVSSLGVYLPVNVSENDSGVLKTINITANDRCWLVRDHKTENILHLAAGTNYVSAVVSLLADSGISTINATETSAVLAEAREDWEVGTTYLDIANELLSEINYGPVWFDNSGTAVIRPVYAPTAENIRHVLDKSNIQSLMLPGLRRDTNIISSPNVFVCICSNPDKAEPMIATAENTNPQSPLSIARRGRRITKVIQINNVASQEALQTFANRQVSDSMIAGETYTVKTCLLPGFGVGEVTALKYGDLMTITKETAWAMDLGVGGVMTHTLERMVMSLG